MLNVRYLHARIGPLGASAKAPLGTIAGIFRATILAVCVAASVPAQAHDAASLSFGFGGGFVHPLAGPDHLLAMVAVGLWGAFLGRPLVYLLPMVFPVLMALGGVLGMALLPLPPVENGIAISVLTLGAAIVLKWRAPVWAASIIVAMFGLFHGYAHGLELPSMADPIAFSFGFVVSTGLLHVLGIAIGTVRDRLGGEPALRAFGALISAAGAYFLAASLRT